MKRIRYLLIMLGMLLSSATSSAVQVSIGIGVPHVSIGINFPVHSELVVVPGYPVYYAPRLQENLFFYDGLYWVYQDDYWYASSIKDALKVRINGSSQELNSVSSRVHQHLNGSIRLPVTIIRQSCALSRRSKVV